ncbi:acyltransferase domain-containing protein, partial [Streptomyces sp. SBT349]|uniref:acyltransferase domain-containing protein n=1 Tax=Streptomyces sp. SBT349 TaxID=1580539 RepID=UPI00131C5D24
MFDEVCGLLDEALGDGVSLGVRDVVWALEGSEAAGWLGETVFTQVGLFAFEVALFRLWESLGVVPGVVAGHSVGEIVAAHVAGVLSLEDAVRVVAARGRLMQGLEPGAMVSVAAPVERVEQAIEQWRASSSSDGGVWVSGVNGPASVVVAGEPGAVEDLVSVLEIQGVRCRRLEVSRAFHTPLVEPMLEAFAEEIADVTHRPGRIPVISGVTGEVMGERQWGVGYWVEQARCAVRFDRVAGWLAEHGVGKVIEIGPRGVLTAMVRETAPDPAVMAVIPSTRTRHPEAEAFTTALAQAYVAGVQPDWSAVFAGSGARRIDLPTYAFQHQRYWLKGRPGVRDMRGLGLDAADHGVLGAAVAVADSDEWLLTGRLSLSTHPWLADHAVGGRVVVPGSMLVDLVIRAGDEVGCDRVEELTLSAPLVLPTDGGVRVQVRVGAADEDGRREVAVYSYGDEGNAGGSWERHASGAVVDRGSLLDEGDASIVDLSVWPPAGAEPLEVAHAYDLFAEAGYAYGPAFQGLKAAWRGPDGELFAEVVLPEELHQDAGRFGIHPALLDAALHVGALQDLTSGSRETWLPFEYRGVRLVANGAASLRVCVTGAGRSDIRVELADSVGELVAVVGSMVARSVDVGLLGVVDSGVGESLFGVEWVELAGGGG